MSKGKINKSESLYTTVTMLRTNRNGLNDCKLVKTESVDSCVARLIKVYKEVKAKEKIIKISDEEIFEDLTNHLIRKYKEFETKQKKTQIAK